MKLASQFIRMDMNLIKPNPTNLWTSSTIPCVFIKKTSLSVRRVNVAAWPSITLAICRINIYHYTKVRIHIAENHSVNHLNLRKFNTYSLIQNL